MFDGLITQCKEGLENGEDGNNLPTLVLKAREADPRVAKEVYVFRHPLVF